MLVTLRWHRARWWPAEGVMMGDGEGRTAMGSHRLGGAVGLGGCWWGWERGHVPGTGMGLEVPGHSGAPWAWWALSGLQGQTGDLGHGCPPRGTAVGAGMGSGHALSLVLALPSGGNVGWELGTEVSGQLGTSGSSQGAGQTVAVTASRPLPAPSITKTMGSDLTLLSSCGLLAGKS